MYALATLANTNVVDDLKIFLHTLQLFNKELPHIYLFCDTYIDILNLEYKGIIHKKVVLDTYDGMREVMEKTKGKVFKTVWEDFMCEKMNLLEWAHNTCDRVLFCDVDICFLGPLPSIPDSIKIGLSRHEIRKSDEKRFGIYNGGFVFSGSKEIASKWREATLQSRYFEQAALEIFDNENEKPYIFQNNNNYGWWRLLQADDSIEKQKSKWSIKNNTIYVEDNPLLSIHTHWKTQDKATIYFNTFVLGLLKRINANELVAFLTA